MEIYADINNLFLFKLIEKSLFTNRQIQIIYNFKNKEKRPEEISSGAYYREVKQSKTKLRKLFYSILLLNLIKVMNDNQTTTLNSILDKLRTLEENNTKYQDKEINNVINVIEDLINRMINM
jgi:hypothetical protein